MEWWMVATQKRQKGKSAKVLNILVKYGMAGENCTVVWSAGQAKLFFWSRWNLVFHFPKIFLVESRPNNGR